MAKIFVFILGLFTSSVYGYSPLGVRPEMEYQTAESEHFIIHYPRDLEKLAFEALTTGENYYSYLAPKFHHVFREKISFIVVDSQDTANGFATIYPRNTIALFTKAPRPDSILSTKSSWWKLVVLHELTHILDLDGSRGFFGFTRAVFGKSFGNLFGPLFVNPNTIKPMWYSEGLAVWSESKYGAPESGRLNSTYTHTLLRTAVKENVFLHKRFWWPNEDWPQGNKAYLYGALLLSEVEKDTFDGAPAELSYQHSGRWFWALHGAVENISQKALNYNKAHELMHRKHANFYGRELETIRQDPITEATPLTEDGKESYLPLCTEKNVYYVRNTNTERNAIVSISGDEKKVREYRDISSNSLSYKDGKLLATFYDPNQKGFYYFYPVILNGETLKAEEHYPELERFSDCSFLEDTKNIACVKSDKGTENLYTISLSDSREHKVRKITDFKSQEIVGAPVYHGGKLYFSLKLINQYEKIVELDLSTKALKQFPELPGRVIFPSFNNKGELYVTSDVTGVFNIYAYRDHNWKRLSNIETGLWGYCQTADGTQYSSLHTLDGWKVSKVNLSSYDHMTGFKNTLNISKSEPIPISQNTMIDRDGDYSSFENLGFHGWAPRFGYFGGTDFSLGGWLQSSDPLEYQQYKIGAEYFTYPGDYTATFIYNNNYFPVSFTAYLNKYILIDHEDNTDYATSRVQGGVFARWPLDFIHPYLDLRTDFIHDGVSFLKGKTNNWHFYNYPRTYLIGSLEYDSRQPFYGSFKIERGLFLQTSYINAINAFKSQSDMQAFKVVTENRDSLVSNKMILGIQAETGRVMHDVSSYNEFYVNSYRVSDIPDEVIQPMYAHFDFLGFRKNSIHGRTYGLLAGEFNPKLANWFGYPCNTFFFKELFGQVRIAAANAGASYSDVYTSPYISAQLGLFQNFQLAYDLPLQMGVKFGYGLNKSAAREADVIVGLTGEL